MHLDDLINPEDYSGTTRARYSHHKKYKAAVEELSRQRYGNTQHQGAIVQEALEFYIRQLDGETLTLDGQGQRVQSQKSVRRKKFSTQLDSGEVIALENNAQIDLKTVISQDVPDTYKKRLPLIAACARNNHHGITPITDIEHIAKTAYNDKTERTQLRYVDELLDILDPFEITDVEQHEVPGLYPVFDHEFDTYIDVSEGIVVGDDNVFTAYILTEVEWQLKEVDEVLDMDTYFMQKHINHGMRRIRVLQDLTRFIVEVGFTPSQMCDFDTVDDISEYIQSEGKQRLEQLEETQEQI